MVRLAETIGSISSRPEHISPDQGYKGHDYKRPVEVHIAKRKRERTPRWMRRRTAIDLAISHLQHDHRLKVVLGDRLNVILSSSRDEFPQAAALGRGPFSSYFTQPAKQ